MMSMEKNIHNNEEIIEQNDFYVDVDQSQGGEETVPHEVHDTAGDLHSDDLLEAAIQKNNEEEEGEQKQSFVSSFIGRIKERKWLAVLILVVALIIIISIVNAVNNYVKSQHEFEIAQLAQLTSLQSTLSQDTQSIENNQSLDSQTQQNIVKSLNGINSQIEDLKKSQTSDHKMFKAVLSALGVVQQDDTNFETQISGIQSQIAALKAKPSVVQTTQIDANSLPFIVRSIEPWNNMWAVSIQTNMGTQLYTVNQNTMGWTIQSINPEVPSVTFINSQNQTATVSLGAQALSNTSSSTNSNAYQVQ